jgi:hypothetical protein
MRVGSEMRYAYIIDDDGDVWPGDDPALSTHLRTHRAGEDLQTFLISRLGFIGMMPTARRMDVAFDRDMVAPKALGGAIYWLREREFVTSRVSDPGSPDIVSLFASRGNLIAHLSDLLCNRKSTSSLSRMPIALEQSAFATRWRAALGICEEVEKPRARHRLLGDLFQGYFSVLSRADTGECTIEHLGEAYAQLEPDFFAVAVGRTFRDMFDKRAGTLLADGYRDMPLGRIEPTAESVRAIISFPNQAARRINYDRMILPVGPQRLLVANFAH